MAICRGPRSTTDGTMKDDAAASVWTLMSTLRSAASWATAASVSGEPLRAKATDAPSRSPRTYPRCSRLTRPSTSRRRSSGDTAAEMTTTFAPCLASREAARIADADPPTTTASRPTRSSITG